VTPVPLAQRLHPLTQHPEGAAVFCDIDGTLAPIVERPDDARVRPDVARLLAELAGRYACVACVTGRRAEEARRIVGEGSLSYAGLHGGEILAPGELHARVLPAVEDWEGHVRGFSSHHDTDVLHGRGVRIEDKGPIAAFHWRGARDEDAALAHLEHVARDAQAKGFVAHWGRKVLEVRPPVPINKGLAVRHLLADAGARFALYGGDDATDLDAFDALDALVAAGTLDGAVRVGVRSKEGPRDIVARADLVVDGVDGFGRVLYWLLHHADGDASDAG
jgi:trehalose 6-phosphate phosphatase